MPAITSSHVNYLVWRYLQEEGLVQSAYTLDKEAHAGEWAAEFKEHTADGELVKLVLKGLQMLELEKVRVPPQLLASSRPSAVNLEPLTKTGLPGGYAAAFAASGAAPSRSELLIVSGSEGTAAYALPGLEPLAKGAFAAAESPTCIEARSSAGSVFLGYANGTVRQWALQEAGTELQSVFMLPDADHAPITSLKRAPSGALLASVDVRNVIAVWNAAARKLVTRFDLGGMDAGLLTDAVWVTDTMLATLQRDGVSVYTIGESTPRKVFSAPRASQLAFDTFSRLLVSASDDGKACLWSSQSDEPYEVVNGHSGPITHVGWVESTPLTQPLLLTASTDGWLKLWTLGNAAATAAANAHEPVYSVETSDSFIVALTKHGVKVYTKTLDKCIAKFTRDGVQGVAIHGRTLVVAASDETFVFNVAFEPAESIEPLS